ncbi:cupin domain-containing protein [Siccirubricoccus sp. G192]|uniref:cupin domain-containing protein n=1 Tax=Siccirubricoccus sp. G192 TaxID=2849651 RepID=UPI001C2B8FD2|nr:cupin domain-containing protein [Siccirubricoccus sp. G192]MBV1796899.1 cupin domain-containing protein [Siccirubricoccus sp. G192]
MPPTLPPTLAETALALGFGGLGLEAVLALREAAQWRHFPGTDPGRFAALLAVPDLDAFLATDAARAPRVSMADGGREGSAGLPDEEFCLPDGRVDPLRLMARFDAGATLVVSQSQDIHPPLARFCRGLERVFLHGVQANAYLTPPGAQGFRLHYDTHDVLVLQLLGQKAWRVWPEQPVPAATRRTPWLREIAVPGGAGGADAPPRRCALSAARRAA